MDDRAYAVSVQPVLSQTTAVVRLKASRSEFAVVIPAACGEVWEFVRAAGNLHPGRHVAVYLDSAGNLEVGVEVGRSFTGNDRVFCSATPAGQAITVAHFGPYARLGAAYDALHRWGAANGVKLKHPFWEVYGHWEDDPAKLRTDIYYLVQT